MESPSQVPNSPIAGSSILRSSNSSTRLVDDVTSLTSFNPFSEEDEHDQSSYTLVSTLFSRVKNTLSAPLSTAAVVAGVAPTSSTTIPSAANQNGLISNDIRRIPTDRTSPAVSPAGRGNNNEGKGRSFKLGSAGPSLAPPLVTPLSVDSDVADVPSYTVVGPDPPPTGSSTGAFYSPVVETHDGGLFGSTIPGFPIQDNSDARSIHTSASIRRSESASKIIRRLRGDGQSRLRSVFQHC